MKLFAVARCAVLALSMVFAAKAKDVALVSEVQAPIMAEGRQIGSAKLPPGSVVAIVSIESDGVMVRRGEGAPFKIAKESIAPEALATPIAPATTPAPTTAQTPAAADKPTPQSSLPSVNPSPLSDSLTEPLKEEVETRIACQLTQPPLYRDVPVFKTENEARKTLGSYHYNLWLPKGYNADPKKQWPCIFIMSPVGNAKMGKMGDYLRSNGFVVVMLVEAKNGPWEPIIGNFLAAHDDVIKRIRISEGKKYATGHSGGARASSLFVQLRPGFCGLILQSAGASFDDKNDYNIAGLKRNPRLRIAMTMGSTDQNKPEADRMKALLAPQSFTVFDFNGGHIWAPADVFEKAMAWVNGGPAAR